MKAYLTTLIAASLIAALVGILSPEGEKSGISKHMKLLTSLFLVCVLIAPLKGAMEGLQQFINGEIELPGLESDGKSDYQTEMQQALDSASTTYFTQMLTQTLESQFSIASGNLRCVVTWETNEEQLTPARVTVILSGNAIWKDPQAIEDYVTELLGCECVTAIE